MTFFREGPKTRGSEIRARVFGKIDQNRRKIVDFRRFLHIFSMQNRPLVVIFDEKNPILYTLVFRGGPPPGPGAQNLQNC